MTCKQKHHRPAHTHWKPLQGSTVSSTRLQLSQAKKMPTREAASLLCSPGRAPWDASQAFFSLLETCLSDCGGERYLPNHSSHCPGRERALSYFGGKKKGPFAGLGWVPGSGWGFTVCLALQMLDPLSSAENSLSGSCQSLDRSADRYGTVAGSGVGTQAFLELMS